MQTRKESAHELRLSTIRQKRCWALTVAELQKYLKEGVNIDWRDPNSIKQAIPLDENNEYKMEIFPECVISKGHNYQAVIETLVKLTNNTIQSHTLFPGKYVEFNFFRKYEYDKETGKYYVYVPLDSIRWMIMIHAGNFLNFHLKSFLPLSSTYAMELFLYLSDWYNHGTWEVGLEEFKAKMGCPANYDYDLVKRKVLIPALRDFDKVGTILTFEFTPIKAQSKLGDRTKGRKSVEQLYFTIIKRDKRAYLEAKGK